MRSAASCCQLLQEIWLPRGALRGEYPAGFSVSVGITDDGNGRQWSVASLPVGINRAVASSLRRGAVDVVDAWLRLVNARQRIVLHWDPVGFASDRVGRDHS